MPEVWVASPGPQKEFVKTPIRDACYGGARAGGKTVALLLHFAARAKRHGAAAQGVIFRRSYPELGEVIRKGKKYLVQQLGWKYTGNPQYTFTSPEGATLMLRHALNLDDATKYDGFEWSDLMFDEIGNWPTSEVCDYLLGCLRSGEGVPTVRRSTCMPGGPGHVWVKERYKPDEPWEPRELIPLESRPDLKMESIFIPAVMENNPHIDKAEYEANLAATSAGGALFEAWRYGRWDVIAGAFFEGWDESEMVIPERDVVIRPWDIKWASGDWGWKDYSVFYWHAMDENDEVITYRELKVNKTTPQELGRLVGEANNGDDVKIVALSPDAFAQRTSTKTIADEISKELVAAGMPMAVPADNDRKGGWMLCNQMLTARKNKISSACRALVQAIPLAQHDPKDPNDVEESPFDDPLDAWRYGLKTFLGKAKVPQEDLVKRYVSERMPTAFEGRKEVGGRLALIRGGQVVEMESELDAANRHTLAARLSRQALARTKRRIRPKALPYGRRYGAF